MLRLEATHGAVFVLQNPTTGTIVGPTQLVTLSVRYESVRLAESVLQHFVALFEDFVFELLRLWLSAYPGGIPKKDKKPVNLAMVIDAPDRVALLQTRHRPRIERAQVRAADGLVPLSERPRQARLPDRRAGRAPRRDQGLARHPGPQPGRRQSDVPGQGRQARSRYRLGQRLEIPEPYLHDTWLLIRGMVQDLAMAAIAKA